jgi:enoyl-CoA hydratase
MVGQKVHADEVLNWGLVDRLVPADDLLATALALGQDVLSAELNHVAAIKGMVG